MYNHGMQVPFIENAIHDLSMRSTYLSPGLERGRVHERYFVGSVAADQYLAVIGKAPAVPQRRLARSAGLWRYRFQLEVPIIDLQIHRRMHMPYAGFF